MLPVELDAGMNELLLKDRVVYWMLAHFTLWQTSQAMSLQPEGVSGALAAIKKV
jgi:hypothetical protein